MKSVFQHFQAGGLLLSEGIGSSVVYLAYFWSATSTGYRNDDELEDFWDVCDRAWSRYLYYNSSSLITIDFCKMAGFSVRLIKD